MGCVTSRTKQNRKNNFGLEPTISFNLNKKCNKFKKRNKRLPIIYESPSLLECSLCK